MRIGLRGRLILASMGMILGLGLPVGLYGEHQLRAWGEARVETDLLRLARTSRETFELTRGSQQISVDELADRLGRSTGVRVTLISRDGEVVGDSEVAGEDLAAMESHADRSEVIAALSSGPDGHGAAKRLSSTVGRQMLYVAVPSRDAVWVVRTAMELSEVEAGITRMRLILALIGLLGLGLAVMTGALASHFLSKTMHTLVEHARAAATGGAGRRLEVAASDELGLLAGSINTLAEELDQTVRVLAEERDRLEIILEGMSEALLVLDAEGTITLVNPAALKLLGFDSVPAGRPLSEATSEPALIALAERGIAGNESSVEFELGLVNKKTALARVAPLRASGGSVVVMHDVTGMRRLEAVRRDFVANVSHELRTPVSVIRANSEMLLDGAMDQPERARSFLEATLRNAERLSRLISDLLDLSRIEAGQYEVDQQPLSLAPLARRAVEAVAEPALAKSLSLAVRIEPEICVVSDEHALDQVLLNLLDNAVKYTPAEGHIEVRTARRGARVRLEVADDGPGIEPRHRARIFERFYRVDPGRSREMGGTGLGLSIVKHLVEAMDSTLGVEPAEPHGAVFWIELPAHEGMDSGSQ